MYSLTFTNSEVTKRLERRFPLMCNEIPQCSISDATACFNFLNALGQQACIVPGPIGASSRFCSAGGCVWLGNNFREDGGSVSSFWYVSTKQENSHLHMHVPSYSSDVAIGGSVVVFSCAQSSGLVSGELYKIFIDQYKPIYLTSRGQCGQRKR
jgi:hypothetical protein